MHYLGAFSVPEIASVSVNIVCYSLTQANYPEHKRVNDYCNCFGLRQCYLKWKKFFRC